MIDIILKNEIDIKSLSFTKNMIIYVDYNDANIYFLDYNKNSVVKNIDFKGDIFITKELNYILTESIYNDSKKTVELDIININNLSIKKIEINTGHIDFAYSDCINTMCSDIDDIFFINFYKSDLNQSQLKLFSIFENKVIENINFNGFTNLIAFSQNNYYLALWRKIKETSGELLIFNNDTKKIIIASGYPFNCSYAKFSPNSKYFVLQVPETRKNIPTGWLEREKILEVWDFEKNILLYNLGNKFLDNIYIVPSVQDVWDEHTINEVFFSSNSKYCIGYFLEQKLILVFELSNGKIIKKIYGDNPTYDIKNDILAYKILENENIILRIISLNEIINE